MPCLTTRVSDLQHTGAIIEALIAPSSIWKEILQREHKEIPRPVAVRMLVDTGASVSAIRTGIANQLGLKAHGIVKISTPSNHAHECSLYDVDIIFPAHQIAIRNVRVIESALKGQEIDGLIGRDILKKGLLVYSGYENSFIFAF